MHADLTASLDVNLGFECDLAKAQADFTASVDDSKYKYLTPVLDGLA